MVVNTNSNEMEDNIKSFYSPIAKYEYLTPLQRKKLREKRKLNCLSEESDENREVIKSKTNGAKKLKRKVPKHMKKKAKTVVKKVTNDNLPEIRCTAAQLLNRNKSSETDVKKKFFKTRSPEHFNKAKFVVPLTYKRPRLDFTNSRHSMHCSSTENSASNNKHDDVSDGLKEEGKSNTTANPLIIKMSSVSAATTHCDPINSSTEELSSSSDNRTSKDHTINKNDDSINNSTEHSSSNDIPTPMDHINGKESLNENNMGNPVEEAKDSDEQSDSIIKSSSSTADEQNLEETTSCNTSPKLFPIFYKKSEKQAQQKSPQCTTPKRFSRIKDTSGSEQLVIDAGQKEFGAKQCKTCSMIYSVGEGEDERLHSKYHDIFISNLKFPGWKKEHVIANYDDGRIIKVSEDDKNFKLKKVQDILSIVNRDLGFSTTGFPVRPNVCFLLFISTDKRVRGCLVAESITSASPVVLDENSFTEEERNNGKIVWQLGSWYASSESVPAVCGINRIWVSKEYRRRKVASRLIDCLRSNFIFGHVIRLEELAFTDPTPDGRDFAAHYTGTDNFLVYK